MLPQVQDGGGSEHKIDDTSGKDAIGYSNLVTPPTAAAPVARRYARA